MKVRGKRALRHVLDARGVGYDVLATGTARVPTLAALREALSGRRYALLHVTAHGRCDHDHKTVA